MVLCTAQIEPRPLSDGAKHYRVKWRLRGHRTGAWQYETFTNRPPAVSFKLAVEAAHHEWPQGWVRGHGWHPDYRPGLGWVEPDPPQEDSSPELLLADFALDVIRSLSGVQARTRADYERDLRLHITPALGHLDIRDTTILTPQAVRLWVNWLQEGTPTLPALPHDHTHHSRAVPSKRRPLRAKTIHNLHGLLYAVLQAALDAEPPLRPSNPASRTRLPRLDDGEGDDDMCFLTRAEFDLLVSCAHHDVRDMLEVFVRTGLRYGELTALQVRDITITTSKEPRTATPVRTGYLTVRRAWKRQPDSTFALGPPKTKQSRRRIALSPLTIDALLPRLDGKGPEAFVFTTATGCWWRHSNFYSRRWLPALAAAQAKGLAKKPRIHDLRHTHVAWLIDEDVHAFKIQKRLGHKSITTTMDRYGHLITDIDDTILNAIDGHPTPPPPLLTIPPAVTDTPTPTRHLSLVT